MTPAAPPKAPPPPAAKATTNASTATQPNSAKRFKVSPIAGNSGEAIVLYGTGGIGKTTLASLAPGAVFLNLDNDQSKKGVNQIDGVETYQDLRDALHESSLWSGVKTIVIDTATVGQGMAEADTILNVKHDKGARITSIESYGYGKGYQYVLETFRLLLSDLDAHKREGRNVVLVCHCTTAYAPNPSGDDYLRYEPDLYQPPKTGRIRDAVKNWCDHMLFIDYDKSVKDGKATGAGTRTIYCQELPHFWAKSRTLGNPIPYEKGSALLWDELFKEAS